MTFDELSVLIATLFCFCQELRAQSAHIHPKWTGKIEGGYDAAMLRLSGEVKIATPRLANVTFDLYPNSRIYALRLGTHVEVARFDVVANRLCPHLKNLANTSFCAYSDSTSMQLGVRIVGQPRRLKLRSILFHTIHQPLLISLIMNVQH